MGWCTNHPNRETNYVCIKNGVYLCQECLRCPAPNVHCKDRTSCIIAYMEKIGSMDLSIDAA